VEPLKWENDPPALRSPIMVAAFAGWNDAASAATTALEAVAGSLDSERVAELDPEEFYDFQVTRPTIRLAEGQTREVDWPANSVLVARAPSAERDLVLLSGIEPNMRWRTFAGAVIEAAERLDVEMVITLGALLADVPHSRPVGVTGITSDEALIERLGFEPPSYEGPTGIVGVIQRACAEEGLPAVSLWASVPHYVAASPNPKVALALVRAFEGAAGLAVDGGELEEAAEDYERQVTAAVASDPEVKAFVERLETAVDDAQAENPPDEEQLPSADTIARDFQRFLRQRGPEDPGQAS
jgi:proteasome assembly chaperone (PAC2) family protein